MIDTSTNNLLSRMSQYTAKDYQKLYKDTTSTSLKTLLADVIIPNNLNNSIIPLSTWDEIYIFYGDFEDLGRYINVKGATAQDILKWRLTINK
jgi:hypothetical protein